MKDEDAMKLSAKRLLKKEQRKRNRLEKKGIKYDFPGYAAHMDSETAKADKEETKIECDTPAS